MAGNRYVIESVPGMKTIKGTHRKLANVEAELGETMLTSDDVSNKKVLVKIGGKKHSKGGTPLNAKNASAIYSDNLKIKDPFILKFFNETGKKAKTFAEISKKYDITKAQNLLENQDNDKIAKSSLEKNIENNNFKLSALFTIQEFHEKKGSPEEHSKHFEPFLDRMGINYEEVFGSEKDQQNEKIQTQTNPNMKLGGNIDYTNLPKYINAGQVKEFKKSPLYSESMSRSKVGIDRLNKYRSMYNLSLIDYNPSNATMEASMREIQKLIIDKHPKLVLDFMTTGLGKETNKSHRPNKELQGMMNAYKDKYKPSAKDGSYNNDDLKLMMDDGVISTDNILDAYDDGKWWYRMVNSDITDISKKEMADLTASDAYKGAVEEGGLKYIHQGDGYYKAYRTKDDGTVVEVEADPAVVDKLYKWELEGVSGDEAKRNTDFLWANKRSLKQARKNKRAIPYLEPLTAVPETTFADQSYYNPDQAINAIQSMSDTQGTKQAMFAPQQQQAANFLAGQQFDLMGRVIGQYEDKNVQAYNQERMTNTGIANRASERLSNAINTHHDKNTILKQQYANSMIAADTAIADNEIAMWQERADRLNLEAVIGEQYAKDPNTGFHEFQNARELDKNVTANKTLDDIYNDYSTTLPPGTDDATIAKLALATFSNKYDVQKTDTP